MKSLKQPNQEKGTTSEGTAKTSEEIRTSNEITEAQNEGTERTSEEVGNSIDRTSTTNGETGTTSGETGKTIEETGNTSEGESSKSQEAIISSGETGKSSEGTEIPTTIEEKGISNDVNTNTGEIKETIREETANASEVNGTTIEVNGTTNEETRITNDKTGITNEEIRTTNEETGNTSDATSNKTEAPNKGTEIPNTIESNTNEKSKTSEKYLTDSVKEEITESDQITIDEAIERAKNTISFRQIKGFNCPYNTSIEFFFYGLITIKMKKNEKITLAVNLIKESGEREDEARNIPCTLQKDVSPPDGELIQGEFKCQLSGLKDGPYYSLRLNNSNDISSIPDDEVALDPMLTVEAIEKNKVLDYSIEENQSADKIPPSFSITGINAESCEKDGTFLLEGTLSKDFKDEMNFRIPLTYPEGVTAICKLGKKENGESEINCKSESQIDNSKIIIEQIIIKDKEIEKLLLSSFISDIISCKNQILKDIQKKAEQVKISFRQISHLEPNKPNGNGFTFFFAAIANTGLKKDDYTLKMKMSLKIGEYKIEKEAKCSLRKNVELEEGKQAQASFDCQVDLSESEKSQINFDDPEAIKISTDNPDICGINEKEMLSPLETDRAIKESNTLRERGALTDFGECIDYSLEENMEIKSLPSFTIISLMPLVENGKKERCRNGKLLFLASFSTEITEDITFDLPLSFPSTTIKCTTERKEEEYEGVKLICKTKKLKNINSIVIEPRLIKKKNKELFFINPKIIDYTEPFGCEDYATIKYQREKARMNAPYSLLQLSLNEQPKDGKFSFFMALVKAQGQNNFNNLPKINVFIEIITFLRRLDDLVNQEVTSVSVNCKLKPETSQSDLAGGFDCTGNTNKNGIMRLDDDTEIGALPDPAYIDFESLSKDYSKPENLKTLNDLPNVTIDEIEESGCEDFGNYTIKGTIENGELNNTKGLVIPFSYPDSSGLCDIEVNGNSVIMQCNNKEEFEHSRILFGQTIIKDSNGIAIFLLNSYLNKKSFGCVISANSSSIIIYSSNSSNSSSNPSESSKEDEKSNRSRHFMNNKTGGLTGGTIAGLVLAVVAAVAIVIGLIIYFRGKNANKKINVVESTFQKLNV